MNITIWTKLQRPENLVGSLNNGLLMDAISNSLDGVCVIQKIDMSEREKVLLTLEFNREDDPMDEPICDQDEAWDWAMSELVPVLDWQMESEGVVAFEADEPAPSEKETRADKNLGDRPFGG